MKPKTMHPTQSLNADARFFFDHAGYAVGQGESQAEGRTRSALSLAAAESFARAAGATFEWVRDPDDGPNSWGCMLHDSAGGNGPSLWGVQFAKDGAPWSGDTYKRVVEAELAAEYMTDTMREAATDAPNEAQALAADMTTLAKRLHDYADREGRDQTERARAHWLADDMEQAAADMTTEQTKA